jgi:hypothetical protein
MVAGPRSRRVLLIVAAIDNAHDNAQIARVDAKQSVADGLDLLADILELFANVGGDARVQELDVQFRVATLHVPYGEDGPLAIRTPVIVTGFVEMVAQIDSALAVAVLRWEIPVLRIGALHVIASRHLSQPALLNMLRRRAKALGSRRHRAIFQKA